MQSAAQIISLADARKEYTVELLKKDSKGKTPLAGATLGLFYEDGSAVLTSDGQKAKGVTDKDGSVNFDVIYSDDLKGGKIYAQEIKAPEGYQLNKDHYDVKVEKAEDFDKDVAVQVTILDEAVPAMGANLPTSYVVAGGCALAVLAVILLAKKKKKITE